ncbi:MAG TPA: B12-binding domain-containing radical SAM protein, partial [Cyanobacteria bacterium UBA11367]|nr:B12-binding domain-containing radical SAM protein [Cyanobacteria bacterium UBA11367]
IPEYSIGLVPYIETVHDRLKIEVRRGCTRGCRFCQPGMLTRPARDVEPEKVVEAIEKGMRATGYNEFSLLSLSCSDYLALPAVGMEIKNRLKNDNISLSLPSQRVDRFDENIANILGGTRQSGLTFAPEAGTQRMRDIVNKGLTNEELLRGVKTAFEQGWDKIKLYFMIGLPGEMDEDVLGIAETVAWLQQECRAQGRKRLNFTITISNFTPKPHTPFQWHSVSTSEFARKQQLLREAFRRVKGVKVNYTDIRISAMEDFIGRGDRRLATVVRRAWELGAGMDAWFDNLEKAFTAWGSAIAESGLTWKYRQVENGEWNVFQSSDSLNPQTQPQETENKISTSYSSFHSPLPWDHIDTGIDKNWLIADLQKALAAATVPDCSFDGCSHCGVCGTDFGHNIVYQPLPIPEFAGEFTPETKKAQRLRVWFGKLGDMTFLSHLDMVRLFDRAVRRASLPIAFTGGYHPSPRIAIASALSLGVSSSGEIVDFELIKPIDIEEFREKLRSQLPSDIPVYRVEEVDLKGAASTQILEAAEYFLTVVVENLTPPAPLPYKGRGEYESTIFYQDKEESDSPLLVGEGLGERWKTWIEKVLATEVIEWEHKTKSGKKSKVNLRDRIFELEVVESQVNQGEDAVILRYVGSCRNDGTMLRPDHFIYMLEQVVGREFQVLHIHRQRLILGDVKS